MFMRSGNQRTLEKDTEAVDFTASHST